MLPDANRISQLHEMVVALADHEMIVTDESLAMSIRSLEIETPVELNLEITGTHIDFYTTPPLYYEETTWMPVFHQLRVSVIQETLTGI